MRLRHQPAQVQPLAHTAAAARARRVGAVEGFGQARQHVGRHAGAMVAQAEGQAAVALALQVQRGWLRCIARVAACVGQQVAQQQAQAGRVGSNQAQAVVDAQI